MKFIASKDDFDSAKTVLIGIPFDGTSSFKSGSRFAPNSIRIFSDVLDTYSPVFDKDIENINFYDFGDIFVTVNNFLKLSEKVEQIYSDILENSKKVISLGGEHLISLPVISTYKKYFEDIKVIHIDAHADLRDKYLSEKYSHATVMRRISEIVGYENIYQFGIRSGTESEFLFARNNLNFFPFEVEWQEKISEKLKSEKIYVSIDLDVLDPSVFPGTGTPEPGGITYKDLEKFLKNLYNLDIIGADVVELLPDNDNSGVSSIVAAKVVRELLILMNK